MRILMWTDRFLPEVRSSAHLFYELGVSLRQRGHEIDVITRMPAFFVASQGSGSRPGRVPHKENLEGIGVVRVGGLPYRRLGGMTRAADQLLMGLLFAVASRRCKDPDAILVYSPPLPLGLAATLFGGRRRIPTVLNVQDLYPQTIVDLGWLKNPLAIRALEAMERAAYRAASAIVVHSPGNRSFLENRKEVPAGKVRVIFNGVNTEFIRPGPTENGFRKQHHLAGKFVVSYAGIMGFAQDLTSMLECANLLRDVPDVVFLLVGEGALEARWRKMASDLKLPNVTFLPMQARREYPQLLAASDVCLVPLAGALRTPVVPGKLQSIMASGRPAVAVVDLGGDTPKVVAESECGMVVPPGRPYELAESIRCLHADPELRSRMGMAGRRYAEEHFSLSVFCSAYENLFRELVEAKQGVGANG